MRKRSFISRLTGPVGLSMMFIFGLGSCFLLSGFALNMFQSRTQSLSDVPLVIPTIAATATAATAGDDEAEFAATVTPAAEPTALVGQTTATFSISRLDNAIVFLPNGSATFMDDWAEIEGIVPTHIVEQEATWDGSEDVVALWKLAYDDDALYGLVEVQDDVIAQTETARTAYLGDSLELEIDGLNDKAATAQSDDFQFVLSPGDFENLDASIARFRGNGTIMATDPSDNIDILSARTGDGYSLAFRIPWNDMALLEPPVQLGIALNINDNDTLGVAKQELMLSNAPNRRWSTPSTWGTVTLRE